MCVFPCVPVGRISAQTLYWSDMGHEAVTVLPLLTPAG